MSAARIVFIAAFVLCFPVSGWGGEIEPPLQAKLASISDNELVSVVARLRDRVDIQALDASLKQRNATRQQRNFEVTTALQQKASETQGPLLAFLSEEVASRRVAFYEGFWIDNLIHVTALRPAIEAIAGRPDVEIVFLEPEVMFDGLMEFRETGNRVASTEPGLRVVNAPALWRAGITGKGRLVMNIDTGVNGNHVALSTRWRGTLPGVQPQHAWYGSGSFPTDSDSPGHGTHTMGIMTGYNPATADTVGVAPGAYWIAGSSSYTGAFQWAVNPDGNPNTVEDVPDVINCSWYTNATDLCTGGQNYWSLMDNVEAAGAVVIWSAGNCGPSGSAGNCTGGALPGPYMTITPPKNRVTTPVNAFAVGSVDGNSAQLTIAGSSSRGPSACDTTQIKPEVVAPGVSVRSTIANGGYGNSSGTSMAAPHVSGTVALLRQVNPNADADQIKYAIMNNARDLGTPGEDNTYGNGIINALAAAEAISPYRISGIVRSAGTNQPIEYASVEIIQTFQNRQTDASGSYNFGVLKDTVQIRFSAFAHYDTTLQRILIANTPEVLNVSLTPLPVASISGTVTDSTSAAGIIARVNAYAQGDPSANPTSSTTSQSNGSYTMNGPIGTYRVEVLPAAPYVDNVTTQGVVLNAGGATVNYRLLPAEVLLVDDDGSATFETAYQSSLGRLGKRYRTFGLADSGGALGGVLASFTQRPVLVWFTGADSANALTHPEKLVILNHLNGGGQAVVTGQNIAQFSATDDTLLEKYLGIRFNGNSTAISLRGFAGDIIGNGVNYLITGGPGPQTSKDIISLVPGSIGTPTPTLYYAVGTDSSNYAGVRVAGPGNSWAVAYFAIGIEGFPEARQDTFLLRSMRYFNQLVSGVQPITNSGVPGEFRLAQNYPNPFNPTTTIEFDLPSGLDAEITSLKIFDLLGREVNTLVSEKLPPGTYKTRFETAGLSSGIYFYRLQSGRFVETRKMMLLQ